MSYFGNINPELLQFIPLTAKRVLEIGCGEGALAAEYKRRNPKADYVAIETHGPAAAQAVERVTRLIQGDFEALHDAEISEGKFFDAIVLGDVLEHMSDPDRVLNRLRGMLANDGYLILSVPNIAHWQAFFHLMQGQWPAEDSGLFDRTHLRFFTLQSLNELLRRTQFTLLKGKPRPFLLDQQKADKWIHALADVAEKMGLNRKEFIQRSSALQYVVVAQKAARPPTVQIHLKTAIFAPTIMEARTNFPADYLDSVPELISSKEVRGLALPSLPLGTPKIVIVQRVVPASEALWIEWVTTTIRAGWLVVAEYDDHPDLVAEVRGGGGQELWIPLKLSHGIQTATPALAEEFRRVNPEVICFPNSAFTLEPAPTQKNEIPRVFFGAANREAISVPVARSFGDVAARYPKMQFEVVHDRAFFEALPTQSKSFHPTLPYDDYLKVMSSCDVALLPLEGRKGELFKSDIKYVEAGSRGLAVIASPAVYSGSVQDAVTGIIVSEIGDWGPALERLIKQPALQHRLATAAWLDVRDHRMFADQAGERYRWYAQLWKRREELQRALLTRSPELARALASG